MYKKFVRGSLLSTCITKTLAFLHKGYAAKLTTGAGCWIVHFNLNQYKFSSIYCSIEVLTPAVCCSQDVTDGPKSKCILKIFIRVHTCPKIYHISFIVLLYSFLQNLISFCWQWNLLSQKWKKTRNNYFKLKTERLQWHLCNEK